MRLKSFHLISVLASACRWLFGQRCWSFHLNITSVVFCIRLYFYQACTQFPGWWYRKMKKANKGKLGGWWAEAPQHSRCWWTCASQHAWLVCVPARLLIGSLGAGAGQLPSLAFQNSPTRFYSGFTACLLLLTSLAKLRVCWLQVHVNVQINGDDPL